MQHDWGALTRQQLGRYAEYFCKMHFTLKGFDVYSSEVDDKGIDFIVRQQQPISYWDVQVKSIRLRSSSSVFFPRQNFEYDGKIMERLLVALAVFQGHSEPDLYLIAATEWNCNEGPFKYYGYEDRKSQPEYALSLSRRRLATLGDFRFDEASARYFGRAATEARVM